MRKYLASLPERSDSHKKFFAFLTSAGVTLFIFGVWSLVNFGMPGEGAVLAERERAVATYEEPVPLEGLGANVMDAFSSIGRSFKAVVGSNIEEAKESIESIDTASEYDELRRRAIE